MKFSLYRPEKINGGLIWLSGLTCNEENFITKAGAQKLASQLGIAIICPDTSPRGLDLPGEHDSYDFGSGAGFYVDATSDGYRESYQMYSYVNHEIYDLFDRELGLDGNIGIFGHSMGGHGALTIGLRNPKRYKSISAFSPIVNPINCPWGQKSLAWYLGDNKDSWQQYDANFESVCEEAGQALEVGYQENFDHSYYFISSFIDRHLAHHAGLLNSGV